MFSIHLLVTSILLNHPISPLASLRLNSELELESFLDSTVHIILHEIYPENNRKYNYELGPLDTPTILTKQMFEVSFRSTASMNCYVKDEIKFYNVKSLGNFKFAAFPVPKHLCVVQIFVSPKHCRLWSLNQGHKKGWDWFTGEQCNGLLKLKQADAGSGSLFTIIHRLNTGGIQYMFSQ